MEITISFWEFLSLMGIPTAATGLCFWLIERRIQKRDKKKEEDDAKRRAEAEKKEKAREDLNILLIRSTGAAIALGEATATALKNVHCNGETEAALAYAKQVKHDQKEFLTEQGVRAVLD